MNHRALVDYDVLRKFDRKIWLLEVSSLTFYQMLLQGKVLLRVGSATFGVHCVSA